MKQTTLFLSVLLVLALAAGGFWWQAQARPESGSEAIEATGVFEARQVRLSAELGGNVVEVLVEEGERVEAGQVLVRLDGSIQSALRDRVWAELLGAQANLALLQAGPTEEQILAAEAQLAQAEANLKAAQAQLDGLTQGARPEEIAAIQANLEHALAQYSQLQVVLTADQIEAVRAVVTEAESNLKAWSSRHDDLVQDTRNPAFTLNSASAAHADAEFALEMARQAYEAAFSRTQPYVLQIEYARLSWEVAQANLAQAQARREALEEDERTTPEARDQAEGIVEDARVLEEKAEAAYNALTTGTSSPPLDAAWQEVLRGRASLDSMAGGNTALSLETLLAHVNAARALRDLAAANLASLKNGARAEELQAAQAQIDAIQAQLEVIEINLKKYSIVSPWGGVVLTRSIEPGETALPGGILIEIGRLDRLELTAYLPEELFGRVSPGQEVLVRVDSYPERVFSGVVLRIADEAEFTPTNVQTKEDRSRLVYAVVIGLENADLALKPGMIADIEFSE